MNQKIAATKERIIKYLENGSTFKDACILAGASEATGHRYKSQSESFKSQCEAAIVKYHHKLVRSINEHATRDGRLALRILQLRLPEVWDPKRKVLVHNPQEEFQRIHDLIYGTRCPREVH